jgi:hypothetical protein
LNSALLPALGLPTSATSGAGFICDQPAGAT